MTPERWRKVKEVLGAALDLPAEDQAAYVARVCDGDAALQDEVRSLIVSHRDAGDLFDSPALEGNASMVTRAAGRLMQGARFGFYRVVEQVGEGGMGTVYRGYDERDPKRAPVAIKVVKPGFDHDDILRRFRRERQILAALDHPNIGRLIDAGAGDDGVPYFVLEYVDGQRIDRYCESLRLGTHERLRLFQSVCAAIDYAHQRRILHRDVKPGNILITASGQPKLLDFGIGKILDPALGSVTLDVTATMLRMMTPEYASPEQLKGEALTEATDIYSLGVLLYELVTEDRPRRAGAMRLQELPGDLEAIARKALRSDPRRRYSSAAELSRDIGKYLEGKHVAARSTPYKKAALWGATAGALIVLALAAVVAWPRFSDVSQTVSRPPAGILPFTTFPGDETQPYFSPDGSKVVFVWDGEDGRNTDVYIKPVNGPGLQRLTTDAAQDLSPAWSPDGRRIAWLRTSPNQTAVFVSPSAGGVHGMITEVYPTRIEAVGRHLDWSRDGKWLALADKTVADEPFAIFLVEVATGRKRRITTPPIKSSGDSSPVFSPDGRRLAFLRSPSDGIADVYVMSFEGAPNTARLTFDNRSVSSLTWTPDGRGIVFASDRTGGHDLWRIPAAPRAVNTAPERLPGITENASEPAFTKDGRKLAYSQSFRDANVWRLDLGPDRRAKPPARELIASTLYDSSPQISPDGRKVAFRSSRSGTNEIWVCSSQGGDCEQLTRFGGPLTGSPRWSPDGRLIAFDSRPQGQSDIYVVAAEGGFPQQVTHDISEDVVPSWSADGRWIYFASNRSGAWQVWKSPVQGGDGIQVTHSGGFAASESQDGRFVYYAKGRGLPALWRVTSKGGKEEMVIPSLKPGFWGYWALGRGGVYYVDKATADSDAVIHFHDFRTRQPSPIYVLTKPPSVADSAFALSPDGSYLLFTQVDQSGSDIMMADYAP